MSSDKGEYNSKSSTKLLAMGYSATLGVLTKDFSHKAGVTRSFFSLILGLLLRSLLLRESVSNSGECSDPGA